MSILVTGGARSGKSSFAEKWCMKQGDSAVYIATGQAFDEEMRERISLHQQQRERSGYNWRTVEEPVHLNERLAQLGGSDTQIVLVDCLTLWLSNILLRAEAEHGALSAASHAVSAEIDGLVTAVQAFPGRLALVSNEVGSGIVPEYALGRMYRDFTGILNRRIASVSSEVFLVTAGIAVELKSREYKL
ncbi:bifunctional adenosylcobinamide kinase/adenosylcobinamide-phosphate guanylyltransferase [Paenibacillus caui]|uniref:bifunctional adenosylcobinamide kinase/adenosylcobinamide-phosphate guanylyltransferase n=1 Tax=Paenibacillus caui TaxID=2873927 RepID=UPI001CA9447F|nr:bifunctional adenosylcobinamide kinase/adenosylcobinamide-phosphate guanylyltransferase [Paenibacillus caui]